MGFVWAMAAAKPSVELCKGINGLEKVVMKEARGNSVEVRSFPLFYTVLIGFLSISVSRLATGLEFRSWNCSPESATFSHWIWYLRIRFLWDVSVMLFWRIRWIFIGYNVFFYLLMCQKVRNHVSMRAWKLHWFRKENFAWISGANVSFFFVILQLLEWYL